MSAGTDPSSSPTDTHPSSNDVRALDLADSVSTRSSRLADSATLSSYVYDIYAVLEEGF
jgi:hypothetical protein